MHANTITNSPQEEMMVTEMERNNLFENTMKGRWEEVVKAYKNNREARITNSQDTVLHLAVADGQKDIVLKLVESIGDGENASNILRIENDRGNTALHLAAALGNVSMCYLMASKDPELVSVRNKESETPLFLAAHHGNKKAFLCLHFLSPNHRDSSPCKKDNGDTILHSCISGEYFGLAFQIIRFYPDLVNSVNEIGLTPLHILASKPNAFYSSSRLGLFDQIIYYSTFVEDLKEETYYHNKAYSINSEAENQRIYPENCETCMNFYQLIRKAIIILTRTQFELHDECETDDEQNPQRIINISQEEAIKGSSPSATMSDSNDRIKELSDAKKESNTGIDQSKMEDKEDQFFPPNFTTFVMFFKLMMKALLVILGIGFWRINTITEKKERHRWANQIMNELVQRTALYKYDDNARNTRDYRPGKDADTSTNVAINSLTSLRNKIDNGRNQSGIEKTDKPVLLAAKIGVTEMVDRFLDSYPAVVQELNTSQKNLVLLTFEKKKTQQSTWRKESPLLIAAKMGVTEIVEKILDTFPVAIQDLDADKKNVVLLAVENRQTRIYENLLNRKILKESVFRQVDNQGNSALHLAAMFGEYRPWLLPGAALQMQWEIKWYNFVKKSMPRHFFVRYNNNGKSPKEIFIETHKDLVKEGREWLTKTSESCSVVAALIATVAFATSATVPGGVDQETGKPILEDQPAFNIFAISSLVALCFSVTALLFFLAILTSRYQEEDFAMDLPKKLLLGLSSLFTSIASILISFCSGHFFVIKDKLRAAAFPIYAATCLPMAFFAIAQLPLYFDLMWAIFKKVPQRSYKATVY